jgi:hypothetical protein
MGKVERVDKGDGTYTWQTFAGKAKAIQIKQQNSSRKKSFSLEKGFSLIKKIPFIVSREAFLLRQYCSNENRINTHLNKIISH